MFATRSPFRPNPIGLSAVKIEKIETTKEFGPVIHVSGVDLLDGTPIYDIKPYLPFADSIPDAKAGFTEELEERQLKVEISEDILSMMKESERGEITDILKGDPRPPYQDDEERVYGLSYKNYEIKFRVKDKTLKVTEIE